MEREEREEELLRSVALQNAQSILLARQRAEESLRKQSEWLRITLSSIGDAVISTDAECRVTFLNGVAEALTGWTQAEAVGQPLSDVFHIVNEHSRQPVENPALRALREGVVVGLANHTILIARDGRETPVDDSAAPIRDEAGPPVGAVLVFRDVTERKKAEQAQAERGRLAALRADVAVSLAGADSIPEILQRSAEAVVRHLDIAFARIWTLDEASEILELRASAGLYTHLNGPHGRVRVGEYKIGRIAQNRQPHLTNAVLDDPNVSDPDWARREGMVAFAGYPLAVEGRVVGVLALFSRHVLTETTLTDLAPLADAVAQCIERKRGEQALRESEGRHRFLADLAGATQGLTHADGIMAVTARMLGRHLGADRCAYAEVEDEATFLITGNYTNQVPSIIGQWPVVDFGAELVRQMAANEPFVMDDVESDPRAGADLSAYRATTIRAVICVPLFKNGKFTAAMAVHQKTPRRWTPEEIQLVRTVVERCWESIERARVEEDLRESEERQRKLADNLPSGFIYQLVHAGVGDSRRFTYVSGGVEGLCGITPAEVIADPANLYGLIVPEDLPIVQAAEEAAFKEKKPFDCQFRTRTRDGRITWLHCRSAQREYGAGPSVWDGIAVDITERVSMEEALRETDRRKDEFIALLAHELRNPLAPLRNGLQVMRMAGGDIHAVAQARGMMERQLGHMVRLIDDLLDISRISQNKMDLRRSRVALSDVVNSAVETARPVIEAAEHELLLAIPPEPIYLDADLTRLAQVFSNLLTNSAKYTDRGGRIWLGAERRKGEVVVSVRDTGIGIPTESLPRIFDMFSQVDRSIERSTGGLGIGLALVKGLVEMHDGTVSVASEGQGKGSTFTVTLPALDSQTERLPTLPQEKGNRAAGPRRRILVVDDNRDSATSMAMMLTLMGNEVQTAHDGVEAVERAEQFRPQVVLMDVGMPRLNGLDATRRIREQGWGRGMTIIALTGWGQETDKVRSHEAGCDGHLVKPVSLPDLEKLVTKLAGDGGAQLASGARVQQG